MNTIRQALNSLLLNITISIHTLMESTSETAIL